MTAGQMGEARLQLCHALLGVDLEAGHHLYALSRKLFVLAGQLLLLPVQLLLRGCHALGLPHLCPRLHQGSTYLHLMENSILRKQIPCIAG